MSLQETIQRVLDERGVPYEVFEHEPVYTNPAMAEALMVSQRETVKSLVVKTKEGSLAVVVLPGDAKMDWKRAASAAGTKKVSFAKPEAVAERVGCEVGCVPPFGHQAPLPVIMDPALARLEYVYFNPGVHDVSLKVSTQDLIALCSPSFMEEG